MVKRSERFVCLEKWDVFEVIEKTEGEKTESEKAEMQFRLSKLMIPSHKTASLTL